MIFFVGYLRNSLPIATRQVLVTRVDHEHAERLAQEACTMGTPGLFVMESSSKMDDGLEISICMWIMDIYI